MQHKGAIVEKAQLHHILAIGEVINYDFSEDINELKNTSTSHTHPPAKIRPLQMKPIKKITGKTNI
jgi:hypothetical protein